MPLLHCSQATPIAEAQAYAWAARELSGIMHQKPVLRVRLTAKPTNLARVLADTSTVSYASSAWPQELLQNLSSRGAAVCMADSGLSPTTG